MASEDDVSVTFELDDLIKEDPAEGGQSNDKENDLPKDEKSDSEVDESDEDDFPVSTYDDPNKPPDEVTPEEQNIPGVVERKSKKRQGKSKRHGKSKRDGESKSKKGESKRKGESKQKDDKKEKKESKRKSGSKKKEEKSKIEPVLEEFEENDDLDKEIMNGSLRNDDWSEQSSRNDNSSGKNDEFDSDPKGDSNFEPDEDARIRIMATQELIRKFDEMRDRHRQPLPFDFYENEAILEEEEGYVDTLTRIKAKRLSIMKNKPWMYKKQTIEKYSNHWSKPEQKDDVPSKPEATSNGDQVIPLEVYDNDEL